MCLPYLQKASKVLTIIELCGKDKEQKQIEGVENAWIVKEDVEVPMLKIVSLEMFGLLY